MNYRPVVAASRLALAQARHTPAQFLVVFTAPFFSVIFLSITENSGANGAAVNAVLAPSLIGLWFVSLDLASEAVVRERDAGTLEPILASPVTLDAVILGRVITIAAIGVCTIAESWLIAAGAFGIVLVPRHPLILAAALISAVLAMTCTATLLAAGFVLTRNAHILQNSLSYPVYILGGVVLPASVLPGWVHPLSDVVFLSWSADLLRESFGAGSIRLWWAQLIAVLVLAAAAFILGRRLTVVVVNRVKRTGSAVYS